MDRYFEKVSLDTYLKFIDKVDNEMELGLYNLSDNLVDIMKFSYSNIELPKRATKYSAGYDFKLPYSIVIMPKTSVIIPTGIKCKMKNNEVLMCYPRSGLGYKFSIRLNNTVGVIDSDYYNNSGNEGHISCKLYNPSSSIVVLTKGEAFMQGVFTKYLITDDDDISEYDVRSGGTGSTGGHSW